MTSIISYWPAWFRDLYGGDWPTSYCSIDVETSGYSFDRDVILEWGHVLVEDGKVIDRLSLVIDWSHHHLVPDHWLRSRLDYCRQGMEAAGKSCHQSYQRMRQEGMKPDKALAFIRDFTATIQRKGILFVAHGGVFDERMIAANLVGFKVAPGFSFGDNGWIDTESVEKASQLVTNERMHPRRADTLRSYFHRVKYTRAPCKSNLDEHCFTKYAFDQKGVAKKDMHAADVDSFCGHLLMEEFRARIGDAILPAPFPPPAARPATPARAAPSVTRVRGQRVT